MLQNLEPPLTAKPDNTQQYQYQQQKQQQQNRLMQDYLDSSEKNLNQQQQQQLAAEQFKERPSRTRFQKVAAKKSDQCDHVTGSTILSSTATAAALRYDPPQKLTSLHADYMLVSGSYTPSKDFLGQGRQSRNKMIDGKSSTTNEGMKQAVQTMPLNQNSITADRLDLYSHQSRAESIRLRTVEKEGGKGRNSATGMSSSKLAANNTKASIVSGNTTGGNNLKETRTERDILAVSAKSKSKRLGDYLQPILTKGASSAAHRVSTATTTNLVSNSKNSHLTSKGHRLFQKVTQSQTVGNIDATTQHQTTNKSTKQSSQTALTVTKPVTSMKQTIQRGMLQKSSGTGGAIPNSSSHVAHPKNMQQTSAPILSPLTKFFAPRYSQASLATSSVSNFKKQQSQSSYSGQLPTADYSKQKENKKLPSFKQLHHTQNHSSYYNKTTSELGLTKNDQHQQSVKQVSQVLQIQRQKLQNLLDQSSQHPTPPVKAYTSSAAKSSSMKQQQDNNNAPPPIHTTTIHNGSKGGAGAANTVGQKRTSHVVGSSSKLQSKNPFKSPLHFGGKGGGLVTQRQPQQSNSSFTKGTTSTVKTLKASNSMIVSMINNNLRQTTMAAVPPQQPTQQHRQAPPQGNKAINRQRTQSQNKERPHKIKIQNTTSAANHQAQPQPQPQLKQRKRMKNSQSQSSHQFVISTSHQHGVKKGEGVSRSVSRSKKEAHQLKVMTSQKDLRSSKSPPTKGSGLRVLRTLSQNNLQAEIQQTILTPRLRYILDDFKEEDISLKMHPIDKSQKPITIGLTQPGSLGKKKTMLGMQGTANSSAKNSPSRSQPVLFLDLAANGGEIGLSQRSRDEDRTVANAREEGRIVEAKLGDQKVASLLSSSEQQPEQPDESADQASLKRLKSEPTLIKAAKCQQLKKSSSPTNFKKDATAGGSSAKYISPSRTTFKNHQSQSLKQMQINSYKKLNGQVSSKLSSKRTSIVQQSQSQVATGANTNEDGVTFSSHLIGIEQLQGKQCTTSNVYIAADSAQENKVLTSQQQQQPTIKLSITTHQSSKHDRNMTNPHGQQQPQPSAKPKQHQSQKVQGDGGASRKSPRVAQFYLSDTKREKPPQQQSSVQSNQQIQATTMVLSGGSKNKMLLPPSLTGGVPKFVGGYTKAGGVQPYSSSTATRPPASSTAGMAKRRKVTDVSFLKTGGGIRGPPPRTQAGARSISKNKSAKGAQQAFSSFQATGPYEVAQYGSNQPSAVESIVVDPQRQVLSEKAYLQLLVQIESQKPGSQQQQPNRREKSREQSSLRDHSSIRTRNTNQYNSKISTTIGTSGNRPNVEQARKQMQEQMLNMQKKQDGSEYNASNLTQITDYRIGKHLGQGAFASVKQAVHCETGFVLAIKVYEKFNLMEPSRKKSVAREINILRKLHHGSIMRLYDVIDTPRQLYLVMEYIQGTQLNNYLQSLPTKHQNYQLPVAEPNGRPSNGAAAKKKTQEQVQQSMLISQQLGAINTGTVTNEVAARITVQVLQGLAYMHARNIYHRDIKPENVIYNAATGVVKIIDFGFACISKDKLRVFCGTPSYMSPEIVSKREYDGAEADVWACGVMLFAMLTGSVPFRAQSEKELFRKIARGTYSYSLQTYAQMVQSKQTFTSQLATFESSVQPQAAFYRQKSGVPSAGGNLDYSGTQEGKSTPTMPPQQIQLSQEIKTLIRNLLTVDEAQRPSAIEILLCSDWLQSQMKPHELQQLQETAAQLQI